MGAAEIKVKKVEPMTVAFVVMKGSYSLIPSAFTRLYGWMGKKGYAPSGPPVGVYFNAPGQVPEEELSWELRSPIAKQVNPGGPDAQGLGVKRVSGGQVAAAMHKGTFDKLGQTYGELTDWIMASYWEISGPPEEVYYSDPTQTPQEQLLTEVRFPVRRKLK